MIEHGESECTGSWTLMGGLLVCVRCGHAHRATPWARMAATDENWLGALLARAADTGAELLSGDRERRA
jgi:hypothetical protein